jgi:hypothetical protein
LGAGLALNKAYIDAGFDGLNYTMRKEFNKDGLCSASSDVCRSEIWTKSLSCPPETLKHLLGIAYVKTRRAPENSLQHLEHHYINSYGALQSADLGNKGTS